VVYPNVHTNNGDLPERAWVHSGGHLPSTDSLDPAASIAFADLYATHPILIALTKFSATAPLKLAAKQHPIRAATMPGFRADMIPALRLDYAEVNRRVNLLKELLDRAEGADLRFDTPSGPCDLHLDLRHRTGHASGGLLPKPGVAGNLPSGEAYIVPYEGELTGDPSRSSGVMPVQFGAEIVRYRIEGNKALEVISEGPSLVRRPPCWPGNQPTAISPSWAWECWRPSASSPSARSSWTRSWVCTSPSAAVTTSAARWAPPSSPAPRRSSTSIGSMPPRPSPT